MYVSSVSNVIRGMSQVFHMNVAKVDRDVAKVDRDVAYVASVSEVCCKGLFKMFYLFQTYVASAF
jgi:hypothetical protein